jgi:ATP-dependent protease HslVU (ClpYQ) peptidase subunit
MTCIIGLVQDGVVYMGADSASSNAYTIRTSRLRKVFKKDGLLFGYTGSFRMGQIIQHHIIFGPQTETESDEGYLVTTVAAGIRQVSKDHGTAKSLDNLDKSLGQVLIGFKGNLYTLDIDYQVNYNSDPFDAIGSGEDISIGAMAALAIKNPVKRIEKALEITAEFVPTVRGPFYVESL